MVNKWVDFVKEWATKHNKSYKDALCDAKCKLEYRKKKGKVEGRGIKRKEQSWLRWGVDKLLAPPPISLNPNNQVSVANVLFGYNDFTNKVFEFLKKHQYEKVVYIEMWRTPVPSMLTGFLNAMSFGSFGKELETKPYDTIFHLACYMKTNKGTRFILEKNEVISITQNPKKKRQPKPLVTNVEQPISLFKMIE